MNLEGLHTLGLADEALLLIVRKESYQQEKREGYFVSDLFTGNAVPPPVTVPS